MCRIPSRPYVIFLIFSFNNLLKRFVLVPQQKNEYHGNRMENDYHGGLMTPCHSRGPTCEIPQNASRTASCWIYIYIYPSLYMQFARPCCNICQIIQFERRNYNVNASRNSSRPFFNSDHGPSAHALTSLPSRRSSSMMTSREQNSEALQVALSKIGDTRKSDPVSSSDIGSQKCCQPNGMNTELLADTMKRRTCFTASSPQAAFFKCCDHL